MARESRRSFLRKAAAASAVTAVNGLLPVYGARASKAVTLISPSDDPIVEEQPVQWALTELFAALKSRSLEVTTKSQIEEVPAGAESILIASSKSPWAGQMLSATELGTLRAAESLALVRGKLGKRTVL